MDWILERAKAFAGALAVALVPALISAFEKSFGFDVPASWEAWLFAAVTGLFVYAVPNKKAPSQ